MWKKAEQAEMQAPARSKAALWDLLGMWLKAMIDSTELQRTECSTWRLAKKLKQQRGQLGQEEQEGVQWHWQNDQDWEANSMKEDEDASQRASVKDQDHLMMTLGA
jgi:hypothetical protein